ncbi:hypothetical protein BH09PLA1_BH09PLA1_23200 [soil metagenome]
MHDDTSSFPPTDWSLIRRLGAANPTADRRFDLDRLLESYMPPMRRFIRQRFDVADEEAEDWLNGFIASRVLQSAFLSRVDRERGKFRALLSCAMAQYGLDQLRNKKYQNRKRVSGEFLPELFAAPSASDPMVMFDRHWAEHAIARALELTKRELYLTKRGTAWEVFKRRYLDTGQAARSYKALATEFAFERPTQAGIAINAAKRVFRRKLKDVLIEYGSSEAEMTAAIGELKNIFRN